MGFLSFLFLLRFIISSSTCRLYKLHDKKCEPITMTVPRKVSPSIPPMILYEVFDLASLVTCCLIYFPSNIFHLLFHSSSWENRITDRKIFWYLDFKPTKATAIQHIPKSNIGLFFPSHLLYSRTSSRMTSTQTQQGLTLPWSLKSGWKAVMKTQFWYPWRMAMCHQRAESLKWLRRTSWTPDPLPDAACPLLTATACR